MSNLIDIFMSVFLTVINNPIINKITFIKTSTPLQVLKPPV